MTNECPHCVIKAILLALIENPEEYCAAMLALQEVGLELGYLKIERFANVH